MLKKILYFILFILIFTQATFAQEVFRVTSVNFDTSNSLIFLTSPDNTTESIMKNVKLTKLQNPKRVYFDINSAVLTSATQNWFLNSGGIKQVKISQFSSNPNKIRIVLYLDESFDQSKIKFLKVNNNLVIQYKDLASGIAGGNIGKNNYYQYTYRDEKSSGSDFYENISISSEDFEKIRTAVDTVPKDDVLNQIQQAFDTPNNMNNLKTISTQTSLKTPAQPSAKTPDIIKKELRLKSKYYLNLVSSKSNGFLLSGFGAAGIEKPIYLSNPTRVAFDIPNAVVNPDITNREFKFGQDTMKVSQFDSKRVRVVITSAQLEKYFPIFSSDEQSILLVNSDTIDYTSLFNKTTDAISYQVKRANANTEEFTIYFNSPVVHSIKRENSRLTMNFYNALRYNDKTFKNSIKDTGLENMSIDLLPQVGLKLNVPLEKNYVVSSYLAADGKSIKIIVKGVKPRQTTFKPEKLVNFPRCSGKKAIVLDPGHGGSDYGAIRFGINEKDLNLDVAKRIQAILESKGVAVYMTRNTDEFISLEARTITTANKNPDIFVSVHVNSALSTEASGLETHYYHENSLDLAQTVHASLISYINSRDRGLFKSRFYVINHTTVPAILVEIGFISNDKERAELVSEQRKQQTANAIAEGILKYLNSIRR